MVLKIWGFHEGWGCWGLEALIGKNAWVLRVELGSIISAGQSNWGLFGMVGGGEA